LENFRPPSYIYRALSFNYAKIALFVKANVKTLVKKEKNKKKWQTFAPTIVISKLPVDKLIRWTTDVFAIHSALINFVFILQLIIKNSLLLKRTLNPK
jgi:hypothetical protein